MNNLFNHVYPERGVYIPFLPEAARGMKPERLTSDVETMVFDFTSFPLIQFSENTRIAAGMGSIRIPTEGSPKNTRYSWIRSGVPRITQM